MGGDINLDPPSDQLRDNRKIPFVMIEYEVLGKFAPPVFAVYVAILKHASFSTREAWPSHQTIAMLAKTSRTTVKKSVAVLEKAGLLSIRKAGRQGQLHNVYTVLSPSRIAGGKGDPGAKRPRSANDRGGSADDRGPGRQVAPNDIQGTISTIDSHEGNPKFLPEPSVPVDDIGNSKATAGKSCVLLKSIPSHRKRRTSAADPRHSPFRQKLEKFWDYMSNVSNLAWNAAEANGLFLFLKKWPDLTLEDFTEWLANYSESDGILDTKTPKEFLPFLHQYSKGPLNEFKRPKERRKVPVL